MARSELPNGGVINSSAPSKVRVRFEDGHQRVLTITEQEADNLRRVGRDLSRPRHVLTEGWRKKGWPFTKRLVQLVIPALLGGVLIAAATRQWPDRAAEFAMKSALINDISKSSSEAYRSAYEMVGAEPSKMGAMREEALLDWILVEGELDPRIYLHFRDRDNPDVEEQVSRHWTRFRAVIYVYLALACCDEFRDDDIRIIRDYLEATAGRLTPRSAGVDSTREIDWKVLAQDPSEVRLVDSYRASYRNLGLELLRRRGILLDDLMQSDAIGFSNDAEDYLRDVRHVLTNLGVLIGID